MFLPSLYVLRLKCQANSGQDSLKKEGGEEMKKMLRKKKKPPPTTTPHNKRKLYDDELNGKIRHPSQTHTDTSTSVLVPISIVSVS